ncbi:hypothetical protein [Pseudanabaena sp. SR411]|uniref:hypothetical protein n=1 Tax=Pseudanabaena sp. SR411 TaxID=1980935 RepID=UPI001C3CA93E|nr:hypothetical protein [Pseudanabaena sp. SR411]
MSTASKSISESRLASHLAWEPNRINLTRRSPYIAILNELWKNREEEIKEKTWKN